MWSHLLLLTLTLHWLVN
uniref:Uncharacterized protein n=1 Tax=Timema monikensis TaxID=170555 RepID=A0A7R9ED10_9NEOP|nr:unnamed protein product [Timema monikensis]